MTCNNIHKHIISPMNNSTHEDTNPSDKTLNFIRQIAYTYRTVRINGKIESYCLN